MALQFNSVKCPECGASLPIEEGRTQVFCSYCGAKVIVTNDNEYIYRHIDEAGVRQAETDRIIRLRELEFAEKAASQGSVFRKGFTILWLILSLIIIAICIYKLAFKDDFATGFLMLFYMGGPVIGGGAYLVFKLLPEKENEKIKLQNGGIRFPKGLEPFSDKNYEAVQIALRNAGFVNITCINIHDLTFGILQKPGKIVKITVDGKDISSGGKVYLPSVPITITYHGK